jgi:hypothetical protein
MYPVGERIELSVVRNRLLEQENEILHRPAIYLGRGLKPK